MSVITQLHDTSASQAMKSSADANPCASYPSEPRLSTRAIRKDSSSSMTAIRSSLDKHRPFPGCEPRRMVATAILPWDDGMRNYTRVLGLRYGRHPGVDYVRHPDQ